MLVLIGGGSGAPSAGAQSPPTTHLDALAHIGRTLSDHLGLEASRKLSSGAQQLIALSDKVDQIKTAAANHVAPTLGGPTLLPPGEGSDPYAAEDFVSRLTGMTQSETSSAWCSRNAVIGFNDSGSFVSTLFLGASPSGSISFNGYSQSINAAGAFTDRGALVADPLPPGIEFRDLVGDPVIGCTNQVTFYYASLAEDTGAGFSFFNSGISVSRSTNGGASFGPAVMAVSKDAETHFLDKPWMAVEPGPTKSPDDDVIHVTYTDFDFSFTNPACPDDVRTAIEYVRSIDGGMTWSTPQVLDEVCGFEPFVQGSQVEAGPGGNVYVAWEHYADFETRDIRISKSVTDGDGFGPAAEVTPVTPIGDSFELQGDFRVFIDLSGLAVNRSTGAVYITWHDGRNRSKPDPFSFCGGTATYCFGDILFTSSPNGISGWSTPVRVNNDTPSVAVDQWMPAVDVDSAGNIWVAFYDRRRDPRNFLIDTFVAESTDGGAHWLNSRVTTNSFAPVTGWEDIVVNPSYMGDYIGASTDVTGTYPGVLVDWGDNSLGDANVLEKRM